MLEVLQGGYALDRNILTQFRRSATPNPLHEATGVYRFGILEIQLPLSDACGGVWDAAAEPTYCYEGGIATVMALHLNHFTRSAPTTLRPLRVELRFEENIKNKIRNKVRSWFHGKWTLNSEMMCTRADSLFHKFRRQCIF